MADASKIEWTDTTWNPIIGCSRVSSGCRNCYAERQAYRNEAMGHAQYQGTTAKVGGEIRWTGQVNVVEHKLAEPLRWRKPRRVFVNSMSDLFHESVNDETIAAIFGVMAASPDHTFQVLTKRAERMRDWFRWLFDRHRVGHDETVTEAAPPYLTLGTYATSALADAKVSTGTRLGLELGTVMLPESRPWPLPNVWLGVSVEDQVTADARIPLLLDTPAAVRWVSAEPLLGPVRLTSVPGLNKLPSVHLTEGRGRAGIDWLVVGGESGPGARPCDVSWIRDIVSQCGVAGVPVFVKQLGVRWLPDGMFDRGKRDGARHPKGGDPEEWPEDLRVREWPS